MRTSTTQPPLGTSLNRSHPLSKGLVGNWLLNEGGGLKSFDSTTLCIIPGANTATAVFKQSTKGNVVFFNATNTQVALGTQSALNLPAAMSISVWINTALISSTQQWIVADDNASVTLQQWALAINLTIGKLAFIHGNAIVATSTASLVANTWYHIGASRSGATGSWEVKLYINGVLDKTVSAFATNPSAQQAAFIGSANNTRFFTGLIGDVKIYNRCLSETDFRQLYTNPYQMFQSGKTLKK